MGNHCSSESVAEVSSRPTVSAPRDDLADVPTGATTVEVQQRLNAILDVALRVSMMSKEGIDESDLCERVVTSRTRVSTAEVLSIWRLRRLKEGEEDLECISSSQEDLRGFMLPVVDGTPAWPVCALRAARRRAGVGAPCAMQVPFPAARGDPYSSGAASGGGGEGSAADGSDVSWVDGDIEPGRAELAARCALEAPGAMYVPMFAPYVGEDGLAQLFGLVEYVSTRRPEADADEAEPTDALRVAGGARSFSAAEEWLALTLSEYVGAAFHGLEAARAEIEGLRLVHRMLPRHIVRQLQKRSPELVVEKSQRTFVLFSDIVSFTSYCASREPRDVVVMLNSLFATFDAQLAKHSVFKVCTIGDAYVVASGLPFMNSPTPELDICHFAMDMLAAMESSADGVRLKIRIGIHVGTVAAGVVGTAMPRYCLFGETVTIAEQMQQVSAPDAVAVSQEMRDALEGGDPERYFALEEIDESRCSAAGGRRAYALSARSERRRRSLAAISEVANARRVYFQERTTTADRARLSRSEAQPGAADAQRSSFSNDLLKLLAGQGEHDDDEPHGFRSRRSTITFGGSAASALRRHTSMLAAAAQEGAPQLNVSGAAERTPEPKYRMRSKSLNTLGRSIVHHMDAAGSSFKARTGVSSLAGGLSPVRDTADTDEPELAPTLVSAPCSAPTLADCASPSAANGPAPNNKPAPPRPDSK